MLFRHLIVALAFVCVVGSAAAQDRLTVTSQYGPSKPQTLFWERFKSIIEAERPGAYDITIVTSGALGGEKEEAEAMRLGAITGALSTVASLTTWVLAGTVLDLPFVFEDEEHIVRALDGPVGESLKEAYRSEGFEVPAFIIFGARHLIGQTPRTAPGTMEDVTMRVLQSDLHIALWRSLGANPTALPITEAYTALSNGVVDAMDMTMSGFEALRLYEVAPVLTETAHIWAVGVVYFDVNFWNGLSDEDKALFTRAARESAAYFNTLAAAEQEAAMARAEALGARRVSVESAPWRAATAPFVDAYVSALDDPLAQSAFQAIKNAR
ncbi:MAG: TRAP transporter substrate-binding protein [Pseudomonadota bacterium]